MSRSVLRSGLHPRFTAGSWPNGPRWPIDPCCVAELSVASVSKDLGHSNVDRAADAYAECEPIRGQLRSGSRRTARPMRRSTSRGSFSQARSPTPTVGAQSGHRAGESAAWLLPAQRQCGESRHRRARYPLPPPISERMFLSLAGSATAVVVQGMCSIIRHGSSVAQC
jgi:hypothetical protein